MYTHTYYTRTVLAASTTTTTKAAAAAVAVAAVKAGSVRSAATTSPSGDPSKSERLFGEIKEGRKPHDPSTKLDTDGHPGTR